MRTDGNMDGETAVEYDGNQHTGVSHAIIITLCNNNTNNIKSSITISITITTITQITTIVMI